MVLGDTSRVTSLYEGTPWGRAGGSQCQGDTMAAVSPRRAGQEPPQWFRLGFARLALFPAPPSLHPWWRFLSPSSAFLLLSFPQDEVEFGYVEAPHKTFPVVFDSPRNRGLKDFAFKKILVCPCIETPLSPRTTPAREIGTSLASLPSFPGPGFWLRDPGAPREERDQPGLLREPGREPAGDGAGQGVPAGEDPHRQPPARVRLRSPQTPLGNLLEEKTPQILQTAPPSLTTPGCRFLGFFPPFFCSILHLDLFFSERSEGLQGRVKSRRTGNCCA